MNNTASITSLKIAQAVLDACKRQVEKHRSLENLNLDAIVTSVQHSEDEARDDGMACVTKHIYLEAVTLDDHTCGPMAVRLTATDQFVTNLRSLVVGIKALGLQSGILEHTEALFHDSQDTGLFLDELVVTSDGNFSFGGWLDGIRTETREHHIDALHSALMSNQPVEVLDPQSGLDKTEFANNMLEYGAIAPDDIPALEAMLDELQAAQDASSPFV